jgi:hypothetical protein
VIDIGHHRAKPLFIGVNLTRQGHAQHGAPMKRAAKSDDGVAPCGNARDLNGVFNGLGTRGDKDGLFGEITGDGGV